MGNTEEVELEDCSLEKLESMAYNLYVEAKAYENQIIKTQQNLKLVEQEIIKRKQVLKTIKEETIKEEVNS